MELERLAVAGRPLTTEILLLDVRPESTLQLGSMLHSGAVPNIKALCLHLYEFDIAGIDALATALSAVAASLPALRVLDVATNPAQVAQVEQALRERLRRGVVLLVRATD